MSYIHNFCKCETCQKEFEYVWLYPDAKFEVIPDREKYVFANHNRVYTKYEVCTRCPSCKTISCFEYSLEGKYIGKRN